MFTRVATSGKSCWRVSALHGPAKPDSKINGVQIGAITYSFRTIPERRRHHQGVRHDRPQRSRADVESCRAARRRAAGPAARRRTRTGEMTPEQQAEAQKAAQRARGEMRNVALVDLDGQVQGCPEEVRRRRASTYAC